MGNTVKNLILALINATLILIALCLFLALKLVNTTNRITTDFAQELVKIQPLGLEIQAATTELAGLRGELAQLSGQSAQSRSASLQRVEERVAQLENSLSNVLLSFSDINQAPARLFDYAIDATANRLTQKIKVLKGCTAPEI